MSCLLYHDLRCAKEKKSLHHDSSLHKQICLLLPLVNETFCFPPSLRSRSTEPTDFFSGVGEASRQHDDVCKLNKRRRANESFFLLSTSLSSHCLLRTFIFQFTVKFSFCCLSKVFPFVFSLFVMTQREKKKGKMFFNMLVAGLYEFTTFKRFLIGMVEMRKRQ